VAVFAAANAAGAGPARICKSGLSAGRERTTLLPCQFTNFIARGASGTARFWFVPANGRGRNVRTAVRPSWRRSSLLSLPQRLAARGTLPLPAAPVRRTPVACAVPGGHTATEPRQFACPQTSFARTRCKFSTAQSGWWRFSSSRVAPPVATARTFAPMALPHRMSSGVSPMTSTCSPPNCWPNTLDPRRSAAWAIWSRSS
jgi:hypothetical protein